MAELTSLKKKRGAHRFVVKTKIQSSELIVAAYSIDKAGDLKAIKGEIVRRAEVLRDLDEQILNLSLELDDEALNSEALSSSNLSEEIAKAVIQIDRVLGIHDDDVSIISRASSSSEAGTGSNGGTAMGRGGRVKLPKLELTKFSGDPRKYQAWRDSYDSLIHHKDSLNYIH